MKSKGLYVLAKKILFNDLEPLGFQNHLGRYTRVLDSGVVHLLALAKDPHGAESFCVMCGVNATQISSRSTEQYGFFKRHDCQHLTPTGWHYNSGSWPCATEEETLRSLRDVRELVVHLALPWLDAHVTLSSVADEINALGMPPHNEMKMKLYLLDGDLPRARAALEDFAAWLANPPIWGDKTHLPEDIERLERMRQAIAAAERGMQE